MNKLDVPPADLTVLSTSFPGLQPARRLIVLVPESEVNIASAARKIWELANALGSRVQFLGLCKDEVREPNLRRQIIAMSALVGGGNVSVESKIEFGSNWLYIVKSNLSEGDVVACFSEQRIGFAYRPLSQILETNLNAKVYVFSGLQPKSPRWNWLANAIAWAGSIVVVVGFFLAQAKLIELPQDWAHTSLLYISLFIEVGLLWMWNSQF